MKKQLTTQTEKFNARLAKASADKAVENKGIEAHIAQRIEDKKDLLHTVSILANSVSLINKQLETVLTENAQLKALMASVNQIMVTAIPSKPEFDVIADHYLDLHKNGLLVTRNEMILLGIDRYATPLHKERADQIKEKGFFVDPEITDDDTVYQFEDGEAAEEAVVVVEPVNEITPAAELLKMLGVTVPDRWTIKWKRGPKPANILEAYSHVNASFGATRVMWPKDDAELKSLIKSFLILAKYEGIDINTTTVMQKCRYHRVIQKVVETYGSYKTFIKELF